MDHHLSTAELLEIVGAVEAGDIDDVSILGHNESQTQEEGLLALMHGKEKSVPMPDFSKMTPLVIEPDEESETAEQFFQKIQSGMLFKPAAKRMLTPAEEAAYEKILYNLPVRDLPTLLPRLKKFAEARGKTNVSAFVDRLIQAEREAA